MQNIGSELMEAMPALSRAGVDSPQLDAEVIMAFTVGSDRMHVISHPEQLLSDEEAERFRGFIERRAGREPLPYITGRREFWGLDFEVERGVLIPRPETETLVDASLSLLRGTADPIVVDVGAGTGCVAISLAVELPDAVIYATEVSHEAAEVARRNATRHEVHLRVVILDGDMLEPVPPELRGKVDAVVSNPPYIRTEELDGLQPEVARFEPRGALDGGPDGMKYHRLILESAKDVLKPGGSVHLEVEMGQAEAVAEFASGIGYAWTKITCDLGGIGRVVSAVLG